MCSWQVLIKFGHVPSHHFVIYCSKRGITTVGKRFSNETVLTAFRYTVEIFFHPVGAETKGWKMRGYLVTVEFYVSIGQRKVSGRDLNFI